MAFSDDQEGAMVGIVYILSTVVPKVENCAPVVRARTAGCFVAFNTPANPPYKMPDIPMQLLVLYM